jgi:hypothetical protein
MVAGLRYGLEGILNIVILTVSLPGMPTPAAEAALVMQ